MNPEQVKVNYSQVRFIAVGGLPNILRLISMHRTWISLSSSPSFRWSVCFAPSITPDCLYSRRRLFLVRKNTDSSVVTLACSGFHGRLLKPQTGSLAVGIWPVGSLIVLARAGTPALGSKKAMDLFDRLLPEEGR